MNLKDTCPTIEVITTPPPSGVTEIEWKDLLLDPSNNTELTADKRVPDNEVSLPEPIAPVDDMGKLILSCRLPHYLKQHPNDRFSPEELAAQPQFSSNSLPKIKAELNRLSEAGKVKRTHDRPWRFWWDATCDRNYGVPVGDAV